MRRAFKYRILPTPEQAALINKTVGCARFVYNSLLNDYKSQMNNGEKPVIKEVTYLKQKNIFLKEVDSLALANAKQNLRTALDNFFKSKKGQRKGKKSFFPRNHKKSKSKLRYTTNNQNGTIRLEGCRLKLPKIGFVEIILHRKLEGSITSCTIEQTRDGKYYASISVELENGNTIIKHKQYNELKIIGIDMSYSSFAVDSVRRNCVLVNPLTTLASVCSRNFFLTSVLRMIPSFYMLINGLQVQRPVMNAAVRMICLGYQTVSGYVRNAAVLLTVITTLH